MSCTDETYQTLPADLNEIKTGLQVLASHGGTVGLHVYATDSWGTLSGHYDDMEALATAAQNASGHAPAVYVTLNEVALKATNTLASHAARTTSDSQIKQRHLLLLDFDPKRAANVSATDEEKAGAGALSLQVRNWLRLQGWPDPVVADSGNGTHLLYRVTLLNDDASTVLVSSILQALAFLFDTDEVEIDQTVFNAARVCKLYGTLSAKGENTPERPHRLSKVMEIPENWTVVPNTLLQRVVECLPQQGDSPTGDTGAFDGTFDLAQWIRDHDLDVAREAPWKGNGRKWILGVCPMNPEHTDRSAFIARQPNGAIAAGCQHNSCPWSWRDLRLKYEPDAYTKAGGATLDDLLTQVDALAAAEDAHQFAEGLKRVLCTAAGLTVDLDVDLLLRAMKDKLKTLAPSRATLWKAIQDERKRLKAERDEAPPPEVDIKALWEKAKPLATDPDLIERIASALSDLGLVGERQNGLLVYLAATARLLPSPVSVFVKGPSSAGKSFLLKIVLKLLDGEAFIDYTSVSPHFLARSEDDLRHRIVVLYEASGLSEGIGAYMMRSLLSEGRLHIGTVDRDGSNKAMSAQEIVKEGPTALFTSTTQVSLDSELETRALSVTICDSQQQSRSIISAQAQACAGSAKVDLVDTEQFQALQAWLAATSIREVVVPFASELGRLIPVSSLRIRRDFPKLLSIIQACALLHQAQRTKTAAGALVATLDDYRIVYELMRAPMSAAQEDGLTPASREAVRAVTELWGGNRLVSVSQVAKHLKIDKSSASRRLAGPIKQGYVENIETGRGKTAKLVPGESLPSEIAVLPNPEALEAKMAA